VERSDPEFERDDASGDDASADGWYPPAPLPPHERTWRHPSELGAAQWVLTEPPATVGRGLLTAAVGVGSVLSLAVLWLMLSTTGNQTPGVANVGTTAIGATRNSATLAPPTTVRPAPATTAKAATTTTRPRPTTTLADRPPKVTATSAVQTVNTTATPPPTATEFAGPPSATALGIVRADFDIAVTTSRAVGDADELTVMMSGSEVVARVLATDQTIAILGVPTADRPATFARDTPSSAEQPVTVMCDEPVGGDMYKDPSGNAVVELDATTAVREGSPVTNAGGALVGLSTVSDGKVVVVALGGLDALVDQATKSMTPQPWLGVAFGDATAAPTVTSIDPAGPAASAGVQIGDTIIDIDDGATATAQSVIDQVAKQSPGTSIVLTIERNSATLDVTVILGTTP
jgi:S1-C subfamily serine protease